LDVIDTLDGLEEMGITTVLIKAGLPPDVARVAGSVDRDFPLT
jgi:hypothetical protein